MRHRPSTAGTARALALATLALCASGACGGGRVESTPVAMLASSPQSAAAFEAIREAWSDSDTEPRALRLKIEAFIANFPKDGLVPLARVALALTAMRQGDLAKADAELALTAEVPAGTTHELRTVAQARRLRLGGDPESALVLLRPSVGKLVDPLARAIFEEELTLTAVATHRDYEAISYMDAWLRASTPDEKPGTIARVSGVVQKLPREVLVGALQAMSVQRATLGYGADIERILAQRLVQIATTSGDAELARMLLETDPLAYTVAGDAGTALGELAASRRGLNVVEGRTIGLLLPTESPGLRDESADVLRGVLWALGLPRGARTASAQATTSAGDAGSASAGTEDAGSRTARARASEETCAPLEPAPESVEPTPEEGVHLVTRDDAGSAGRTEVSLDELAGEGAAMVIAGLDGETAERALRWGQNHSVPVIVLVPPGEAAASPSFGFVLGEPRTAVLEALSRADPALATERAAPIADTSGIASYPPQGGRFGGFTLAPPVSCDIPAVHAGDARFPIEPWQADKTRAWLVSGSPQCATDLINELSTARAHGVVALTLEAAAVLRPTSGLRVVSARAGIVPEVDPRDPRVEEVRRFSATLGTAGWWTALGRDAATLARSALLGLPVDSVSESHAVADWRTKVRDALASTQARLWTTESSGWTAERTMKRALCTVDSQAR